MLLATSMMLIVRVLLGTRSGRARRSAVLGNALPAPPTNPPPGTPNFPASAGNAAIARRPDPPFRLRSRPLPQAMTAGADSRYHLASVRMSSTARPQIAAARAAG